MIEEPEGCGDSDDLDDADVRPVCVLDLSVARVALEPGINADAPCQDAGVEALLERAREGDHQAFAALVGGHRRELTVHCYRMLGSMDDADDAVQETLVAAWRALAHFEGRSSLRTWLYEIATNVSLRMMERRRRLLSWDRSP